MHSSRTSYVHGAPRRRDRHRLLRLHAIAPKGFGSIKRHVGALQPIVDSSRTKLRYSRADRQECPRRAGRVAYAKLLDLLPHPTDPGLRVRERLLRENHEKLLPAVAVQTISAPEMLLDRA